MKRVVSGISSCLLAGVLALPIATSQGVTYAASAGSFGASTLYPQGAGIANGALAAMPAAGSMKIVLYVQNLMPMQIYTSAIQSGTCTSPGATVYSLPNTQADADGSITVSTLTNTTRIPAQGLVVTTRLAQTGAPVVACGNVHPAGTVIKLQPYKISTVPTAQGYALVTKTMGNHDMAGGPMTAGTEIVVFAENLEPSTVHEEHIHAGACNANMQGQVRYPLSYLETDPTGQGVASTFLTGSVDLYGNDLNVHAADLRPAACGNFG